MRGHENDPCEIATVSIAYKNGQIIDLLTKRGTFITNGKFDKLSPLDDKINELFETQGELLTTAVAAYVTFTTQEGLERCLVHLSDELPSGAVNHNRKEFRFLGEDAKIDAAPEPSNIIWENLEVSDAQINTRKCITGMIIAVFIFLTFLLFTYLKTQSGKNKLKYPSSIDCKSIYSMFSDEPKFRKYAEIDREDTANYHGEGYYMCYCKMYGGSMFSASPDESSLCF